MTPRRGAGARGRADAAGAGARGAGARGRADAAGAGARGAGVRGIQDAATPPGRGASRRALLALAGSLLLACEQAPATFEDCAALTDAVAREDCRLAFARQLIDQPAALDQALASLGEVESRDLLLLRLAVAEPSRAGHLCQRVQTPTAQEKCRQVLGRPHLSTTPRAPQPPPDR